MTSLNKMVDIVLSAKTTLPWLLSSLGAPTWASALTVPIREAGALLPQLWIKNATVARAERVALWRMGIGVQIAGFVAMAAIFYWLQGTLAGVGVLLALTLLTLGRAVCSLTMKDIQGALVEKGRRGRLVGFATTASGMLSIAAAVATLWGDSLDKTLMLILFGSGISALSIEWALSWPLRAEVEQQRQSTPLWQTLKTEAPLRQLIISRSLLLQAPLAAPFVVMQSDKDALGLGYFLIVAAIAQSLSSWLWGKLADVSARRVLALGATVCIGALAVLLLQLWFAPSWLPILSFFLLSVGSAGIKTGRKTYLLDIAEGDQRTRYTATANTCVGVTLLLFGAAFAGLSEISVPWTLAAMAVLLALGLLHTRTLQAEK